MRKAPNIVITGTPGVGKTTLCESLAEKGAGRHLSVNQVVKDKGCHEGWSDDHQSWIVDEDKASQVSLFNYCFRLLTVSSKLLDAIEEDIKEGGCIIDWHACDLYPESWIDLVVVLRTDSKTLYDRLESRKYPEAKLQENMDAEIMEVILQEAHEAFDEQIVIELTSNTAEEMESNQERIEQWIEQWKANNNES